MKHGHYPLYGYLMDQCNVFLFSGDEFKTASYLIRPLRKVKRLSTAEGCTCRVTYHSQSISNDCHDGRHFGIHFSSGHHLASTLTDDTAVDDKPSVVESDVTEQFRASGESESGQVNRIE